MHRGQNVVSEKLKRFIRESRQKLQSNLQKIAPVRAACHTSSSKLLLIVHQLGVDGVRRGEAETREREDLSRGKNEPSLSLVSDANKNGNGNFLDELL